MFNNENGYSLSDIAAATGAKNEGMWDNGSWWIIILFLFIFAGGWGTGFGKNGTSTTSSGITDGYILTSDFASLERQMENGFDRISSQGVQIANGLSSLGYDQLNQMNGINQNINNSTNGLTAQITALGSQMQQCCCDNKYQSATQYSDLNYRLAEQSCQTRQTVNDAARDITLNNDSNTRSILAAIQDMQTQNLQDKINTLTADNQALKFAASQQAQNAYLVSTINPTPSPAYMVPNPYTGTYGYAGCNCGCTA